jgi:hypothetical protein
MRVLPPGVPPELSIALSWRDLWRSGAFVQLDLTWASNFASHAAERGLRLGVGDGPFEELDLAGALQPIAFAAGGNQPNVTDPTPYEQNMTFRDEQGAQEWSTYAWEFNGHPEVTALYSPWQILYLDDVIARAGESLALGDLLAPPQELIATIESRRRLLEALRGSWSSLHESWQPLMKLLVRLQNRYGPEVTGRITLPWDANSGERVNPYEQEAERFDATTVAEQLGTEHEQLLNAYWFLVERGIGREPRDGMELLRRARPRDAHATWRGPARHVEDHFEAAQILRQFLTDLAGELPARPPGWPMDGRQAFRALLYDRGPVPSLSREEVRSELHGIALQPHRVHVVGEGKSEKHFVTTLIEAILGERVAEEIGFTDLKGSGSARHLATIVRGLSTYVEHVFVIVDLEGKMEEHAKELERTRELEGDDILRFSANIEEDNFSTRELIDVVVARAANPPPGRQAVSLRITEQQLEEKYRERGRGAREKPGRAGVLLKMAEDPQYGGPVRITKPQLASALAERMLDELDAAHEETAREQLLARRPILRFTLERVAPPLAEAM